MTKEKRLFALDLIRSLSILLIIVFHYNVMIDRIISPNLILFSSYNLLGAIGVSLFIILSGSSISLSNLQYFKIKKFYIKRFIAIFPLFYICYLFILLMNNIFIEKVLFPSRSPITFLLTLAGMDGFLLFKIKNYYLIGEWFLGFIIIFYIAFPIIRFLFVKQQHIALIISAIISFTTYYYYTLPMSIFRFPPIRLFEFVFGIYLMVFFQKPLKKIAIICIILSGSLISLCLFTKVGDMLFIQYVLLGCFVYVFLYSIAPYFDSGLCKTAISFLSKYSYGAFLVHHQIIYLLLPYYSHFIVDKFSNITYCLVVLIIIYLISFLLTNITMAIFHRPETQFALKETVAIN